MPPNSDEVEAYKMIEQSCKNVIDRYNFKFDTSQLAIVKSIDSSYKKVVVEINGQTKNATCHTFVGQNIAVGDVVTAIYLKGNMDKLRIIF